MAETKGVGVTREGWWGVCGPGGGDVGAYCVEMHEGGETEGCHDLMAVGRGWVGTLDRGERGGGEGEKRGADSEGVRRGGGVEGFADCVCKLFIRWGGEREGVGAIVSREGERKTWRMCS